MGILRFFDRGLPASKIVEWLLRRPDVALAELADIWLRHRWLFKTTSMQVKDNHMKKMLLLVAAAVGIGALPGAAQAQSCQYTPRQIVEQFFDTFYVQKQVRRAFETWVSPAYIQHNPMAPNGRDAAIAFLEPFFTANPGIDYSIKRIIAEGNLVAVHSHGRFSQADRGMAIIDIVRVADCKVVEHWDVVQPVPETSMNENTMF